MTNPEIKPENPLAFVKLDLPDGNVALQRRTLNAPSSPNKLQYFGGHVEVEEGETMMEAAVRELKEETDLPVDELDIQVVDTYFVPKSSGLIRVVGLAQARIRDINFHDFEGQGTPEAWDPMEALKSGQLVTSVDYIFRKLLMIEPVL